MPTYNFLLLELSYEYQNRKNLFAKSDMAVMILGDNGTGKEHIAEKIHLQSKRADKPFEVVDCGTLSAELAVSALFGHEKGAFTSAEAARKGYFELAAGDTLFLDEIGNLPKDVQAMLLRELKSCIMRAMLLCENEIIDVEDLQLSQSALTEEALDFDEQERKINRERILWALKQCNGIKRDAAKMLEMSHTTFYARMKEYGIPTNKL